MSNLAPRSVLAVPGDQMNKIQKALTLAADEVFFDLEDAVAESHKDQARANVVTQLGAVVRLAKRRLAVRVNSARSGYLLADLSALYSQGAEALDAVILPKVTSVDDVVYLDRLLTELEAPDRSDRTRIEVLFETTSALSLGRALLLASPRVDTAILGLGDYTAEIGIPRPFDLDTSSPIVDWASAVVVNAAVSAGVSAIDGPYPNFRDALGYRSMCGRARATGFQGKWCIHPDQIELANQEFAPDPHEVAAAHDVISAYEAALSEGRGAIQVNGRLVDEATRVHALRILSLAGQEYFEER